MIRLSAGLTTKNASQFAITRNVQQLGANLYCSTDRETISYTLEGTPDVVEKLLPYLGEVATQQTFRPWEIDENLQRARVELASRPPQVIYIFLNYLNEELTYKLYTAKGN